MAARGVVNEYLDRFFQGLFSHNTSTFALGVVPVLIAEADPERATLLISNPGSGDAIIAPSQMVSASLGYKLFAGGGALTANLFQDATLPALAWWGLALSGAPVVTVVSTRREIILPKEGRE